MAGVVDSKVLEFVGDEDNLAGSTSWELALNNAVEFDVIVLDGDNNINSDNLCEIALGIVEEDTEMVNELDNESVYACTLSSVSVGCIWETLKRYTG